MARVLAFEPWLGGSHLGFLEQWRARSAHALDVAGLPARHWKWRMRSAAWELARAVTERAPPDVLFVSDYVDLPALRGWLPASWAGTPSLAYFHESQLTYPTLAEDDERDLSYGFTNLLTLISATRAVFNSRFHLGAFARAARELLATLPRPNPTRELELALARAAVVSPGIDLERIALGPGGAAGAPLRVLFNHRWEHDKDPAAFLRAARDAARGGARLELVLLGQRFGALPHGTAELLEELAPLVAHAGFVAERARYRELVETCDVVVSTARHEFCGLSVLEALAAGCAPLLPARLSYPEIVPAALHGAALYAGPDELVRRLLGAAGRVQELRAPARRAAWRDAIAGHDARVSAERLDDLVAALSARVC